MAYIGRTPTGSILTGADIADGSISTAKLADTAVSTAKIADDAVTNAKTAFDDVPFKNIIINGDMSIDQRNSGASQTIASANTYYIDRFLAREVTDGALTIDQDTTSPDDFTHSMKITTTTADSSLSSTQRAYVVQKIEGYNISKLAFGTSSAKSITISFYVRSSLTGTFSGSILNESENRSYVFEYTISSANTWERKTITIAGDTSGTWDKDNTVGILIYFSMGMGSTYSGTAGAWSSNQLFASTGSTNLIGTLDATWYMTGLQIEEGTSASDFEFLPFDVNLKRCQRYYEIAEGGFFGAVYGTASDMRTSVPFKVTKRANPTLTKISGEENCCSSVTVTGNSIDQTLGARVQGTNVFSAGASKFFNVKFNADSEL